MARAGESFTSGRDTVTGVRPEILASWCRCRDRYDVDPRLRSAPGAVERNDHRFEQDVILTRVGGLAALAGREMAQLRPHGFRRVHRRFLVNPRRVAELERGAEGELFPITEPRAPELIPVSRRHTPEVRRLLGV